MKVLLLVKEKMWSTYTFIREIVLKIKVHAVNEANAKEPLYSLITNFYFFFFSASSISSLSQGSTASPWIRFLDSASKFDGFTSIIQPLP